MTSETSSGYRVGIDLGGTKIEAIALGRAGEILHRQRIATPRGDYPGTVAAIEALVADVEAACGRPARAVGVAVPGTISPATGLMKNANSTWLIGRALDRDLGAHLKRDVRLANDADCFVLSEAADGAAAGAPSVFGVILGTGVGGGIVIDGKLVTGPNAIAGEWGHNPLPWPHDNERPGPPCYCGKEGCIETFLSGPGVARDHEAVTGQSFGAVQLLARAEAGDSQAEETLRRFEERLARALAGVMNILDPAVIVLGGGLSNMRRIYDHVPALWTDCVFSDSVATRLVQAKHGDSSGVRGAAWLWPA